MRDISMLTRTVRLAEWSLKVFKSDVLLLEQPLETELLKPTLSAADVSDVPAEFVADPFLLQNDSQFYLFFEVLNKRSERGEIGVATSHDGEKWKYERIVLKEKYHLSYPYVFKYENHFYMIPESKDGEGIFLYCAKSFPFEWEKIKRLIGGMYVDPSIIRYDGVWWMLAGSPSGDKLYLFYSDELTGEWIEHRMSPLISNNKDITRPAGRIIFDNGNIYRVAQGSANYYGEVVKLFRIEVLSKNEYKDYEIGVVLDHSNKKGDWRKDGMHHIDQLKTKDNQWLIAVDGHIFKDRNMFLWRSKRFFRNPVSSLKRLVVKRGLFES